MLTLSLLFMREIRDEDIIKVGVFGFAVIQSTHGYIYCLNIENGDIGARVDKIRNDEDTIIGILPAPVGTFAYFGCSEKTTGSYRPDDDCLGIEYPGEKPTDWKKELEKMWEVRRS